MRLFDTHCHFETCETISVEALLSRATEAGVAKLTAVGGSDTLNAGAMFARDVSLQMRAEGRTAPEVLIALGYDRDQINTKGILEQRGRGTLAACNKGSTPFPRAAVGEIGLDYHYSPETRNDQRELFAAQLEEARRENLPVIIHTREAADDTLALLREIPARGIIHCFTGEPDEAKAYLDLGFFISLSGIVTFKAAENVRASARVIPDDRLLIETDAPFLSPVPMRGQPNEPAFIRHTCAFLASLRGMSTEAFSELTFINGERAFQ